MPDEHSFGVRNLVGEGIWNAAKCIHGEPSEKELAPDNDLGRSTKPGCRNVVRKQEDDNRIFGTPTIRTDIPYKEKRSIADYNVTLLIKLICFFRTTEMSPKLWIFYSPQPLLKWEFQNTISNYQDKEKKSRLCLKE